MHRSSCGDRPRLIWKNLSVLGFALLLSGMVPAQQEKPDQSTGSEQSSPKEKKDQKSKQPTVKLRIQVSTNKDKPIGNASVYVRFNQSGGLFHQDRLAELNLKTNQDGSVKVPEIPQGQIMIQVIATGWHTFGRWFDIEKDEDLIKITLEPPPHLY
jgi:hypothetical protein